MRIPPAGYVIAVVVALFVATQCHGQTLHGIQYKHLTESTALPGHYWMRWDRLTSTTDEGDNVAYYAQHYHTGRGPAFGLVVEVQRALPGASWGLEVDMMQPRGLGYQVGVGVVVGGYQGKGQGHIRDAFLVVPWQGDRSHGVVDYGLRVDTHCMAACVSIPAGESVELADDPVVGRLRFDPATGILGMWRADGFLIWGIQQATGQQFTMRRFD